MIKRKMRQPSKTKRWVGIEPDCNDVLAFTYTVTVKAYKVAAVPILLRAERHVREWLW